MVQSWKNICQHEAYLAELFNHIYLAPSMPKSTSKHATNREEMWGVESKQK